MKIAIEAQRIFRVNKHGMDFVALEVIRELQKIDRENEYFILVNAGEDRCLEESENMHIVTVNAPLYPLWEQVCLPEAVRRIGPDILHCTGNTAPLRCDVPLVLTLHDIIFLEKRSGSSPSWYQNMGWYYRRFVVPRVLPKCRRIITVSNYERERIGSALQIGGDLGEHFGKMLRMDDKDCRLATLCGMSALFSALFGTPLAAVFFALEVVSIGVLYYSGLIPCITSSLVAYAVSLRFGIEPMRFAVAAPETGALTLARAAVLALGCALVSILFCEMLHRTEHLTERLVKNDYLRAFLGGCLVIALTLLAGCRDYNGAGGHVIAAALGGTAKPEAFLLKIVFTAVTLGCGFKGGEIVPTLFVGSTFGCAAGALLGLPAGFAAALGITGLFCGMTNCPITSLLISVELFGADGLLCYAVVCAVSYVCSGYRGLYSSQTILYSKLRAEFINVHTK